MTGATVERLDRRWLWALPAVAAASYAAGDVLAAVRTAWLPKNVAAVRSGALVRAGQLRPEQLASLAAKRGFRTVVCLNEGEAPDEPAQARALGLRHLALGMPGDGLGEPKLFHEFLRTVADPAAGPTLVHCAAGAMRTGVAVAAYRVVVEGWTEADAVAELAYYGCPAPRVAALARRLHATIAGLPADLAALKSRGPEPGKLARQPTTRR